MGSISRTVVFSILLIVIGVANTLGFAEFQPDAETLGAITSIVGVITWVLRYLTTTPMAGPLTKQ